MRFFITGGSGIVGKQVINRLRSENNELICLSRHNHEDEHDVKWIQGDINDLEILSEHINTNTIIIHAAGLVAYDAHAKKELYKVNVEGTKSIIDVAIANGARYFIQVSSIAALGRRENQPITEQTLWEESDKNTYYGISKYQAEIEVWRGIEEGLKAAIINPSVILGKGPWNESSSVVFKHGIKRSKYYTPGSVNYVDARDIADFIALLAESEVTSERFILSAGRITKKEFFHKLATIFNKPLPKTLIKMGVLKVIRFLDFLAHRTLGRERSITRDSLKVLSSETTYDGSKATEFKGFKYRDLDNTLHWAAPYYVEKYLSGDRS